MCDYVHMRFKGRLGGHSGAARAFGRSCCRVFGRLFRVLAEGRASFASGGGGPNKNTPRPPPRESEKLEGGLDPPPRESEKLGGGQSQKS